MKKFQFKLETLLKLKIRAEEVCRTDYAEAKQSREAADVQVLKRRNEIDSELSEYAESIAEKVTLPELNNHHHFLLRLNELLDLDLRQQAVCRSEEENALARLVEASRQRKMVEKLKEKDYEEYKIDAAREEDKFLSELGTGGFVRKNMKSEDE